MSPRRVHGAFCTGLTWAVKLTMPPLGSICRIMPTAIKTTSTFQRFQHTDSEWFRMIQNHLENGAFFYLWNLWSVRSHSVVMLLDATCNSAVSYRKCSKCSNTWSADLRSIHILNDTQLVVPSTAGPTSDGNTLSCHAARGGMQVGAFLDAKLLQKIRKKSKMPNEEGIS